MCMLHTEHISIRISHISRARWLVAAVWDSTGLELTGKSHGVQEYGAQRNVFSDTMRKPLAELGTWKIP